MLTARRLLLPLVLAAAASGCAGAGQSTLQHLVGGRVVGDAEGVTVTGMSSRLDALPLAVAHCARFGKSAQFARSELVGARFNCTLGR